METPKLLLPLSIWQQLQAYTRLALPNEFNGLGLIRHLKNHFWVDQIFIPRQRSNANFCETLDGATNEVIYRLVERCPERVGDLRFQVHSHGRSPAFWSEKDEKDIAACQTDWMVNMVMNVHDQCSARLDIFTGIRIGNLPLEVEIVTNDQDIPDEIWQTCRAEMAEKVQHVVLPPPPNLRDIAQAIPEHPFAQFIKMKEGAW